MDIRIPVPAKIEAHKAMVRKGYRGFADFVRAMFRRELGVTWHNRHILTEDTHETEQVHTEQDTDTSVSALDEKERAIENNLYTP